MMTNAKFSLFNRTCLCLLCIIFGYKEIRAQQNFSLQVEITDNDSINNLIKKGSKLKLFSYKSQFQSKNERTKELQRYIFKLNEAGYPAASADSVISDSLSAKAFLHLGSVYRWSYLRKGNVSEGVLNLAGFREKVYRNIPFSHKELRSLQEKILVYYENNGYPFASVKLDSIEVKNNLFSASLSIQKNMRIKLDSIIIKGNAKIVPVYLYSYLSIKPGDLYNESLIARISTRLQELPFVREIKPASVLFSENETKLYLFLEDKKANQFDGIIGFLPNANNTSQLVITGEAKLNLSSPFGRGEQIDLNWRKLNINTQDLKTRVVYPFVFSSPFGIDLSLALYKKDTLFVDLSRSAGIQYLLQGGNYLKVFVSNKQSTLLSTEGLENAEVLPDYADVSSTIYGLGIKNARLDYRLNPRRGFALEASAGAGSKHITKNDKIPAYLYDNLKLDVTQYNIDYTLDTYFPVARRMVLNAGIKGAHLVSSSIFQNELYRIGGLKTLRGFDEESIFASSYAIAKLEYRYIMETNAYLFAFWNGAMYENKSIGKQVKDTPYGYGAGITFETKLGIFTVTYALGSQFDNPIYFRSGKIHFGIVNYF